MANDRGTRDLAPTISAWMAAVAPERPPDRLLEESFSRTMTAPQLPVFPWHRWPRAWLSTADRSRRLVLAGLVTAVVVAIGASLFPRPQGSNVGGQTPGVELSLPPFVTSPPTPAPSFPTAVTVQPIASIPIDAPMALASDGTTIWLFTANGDLLRIDPQTNTVAASVKLSLTTDDFQAIAGDATGLWVTDWTHQQVLRFDPQTLRSVTSIDTGSPAKGLLLSGGSLWMANTRGGSVQQVDPRTNTIIATIPVGPTGPSGPNWLTAGLGSIWTSVPNIGSVVRINATTEVVEATIAISGPAIPCGGLAAGSTAVWVTSCGDGSFVAQIDPSTNTAVGEINLGGAGQTIALVGDRAWASPQGSQLVRLDPVGHAVDRAIVPAGGFSGGGDVVVAAGSFWVMDGAAGRLLRLPIEAFGG